VIDVNKEGTDSDEGVRVRVHNVVDRVKRYRSQKVKIPKSPNSGKKKMEKKGKGKKQASNEGLLNHKLQKMSKTLFHPRR
jgi:hypothetical protein